MDVRLGSFNLLNLRLPNRPYYSYQGYSEPEYRRKTRWLAGMFDQLRCDLLGVQEVFDEAALQECVDRSKLMKRASVFAPHAEGDSDLPRVGLVTTLDVLDKVESTAVIPKDFQINLPGAPEMGVADYAHENFSRPVLSATVDIARSGRRQIPARVYVVHLKSRRPKRLAIGAGDSLRVEEIDNPIIETRAHLRSLMIRAAESSALRNLVLSDLHRSDMPVIVLGDFNDHAKAMTTELVTGRVLRRQRERRDIMLWHASALQRPNALKRDLGYTKIYLDEPDSIDHILLSEQFLREGRNSLGEVLRVDYFNDHLNEKSNQFQSDHGAIRATLLLNGETDSKS